MLGVYDINVFHQIGQRKIARLHYRSYAHFFSDQLLISRKISDVEKLNNVLIPEKNIY